MEIIMKNEFGKYPDFGKMIYNSYSRNI